MTTRRGTAAEAGAMVRRLRGRDVSQAALAIRAQTSQSYISRLEAGDINPTVDQLEHLLKSLGYALRLEATPLAGRSDPASYAQQLAMTPEERIQGAAAIQNTIAQLREGVAP